MVIVASTREAWVFGWCFGFVWKREAGETLLWNGQGLEESLVNGITTPLESQLCCEKGVHLQGERHCRWSRKCRPFTYSLGGVCSANQYAFST